MDLAEKTKRYLAVIRLTPFDTSTDYGRSQERYRRMALTSLASVLAKAVTILASLVSVPMTVRYLGSERYGMWMTASSVLALLSFADLGMGNGLLNAISESHGEDDRNKARRYVSSAFFMLTGIAALILLLFFSVYPFIPWSRVFNVGSDLAIREAGPSMAIFIVTLAVGMPLGVAQRVQLGYQEGFKTHLWGIAGGLLGFCGIVLAIWLKAGLPWLVLAMTGGTCLTGLLNWLELFCLSRKWLFPCPSAFDWKASRKVARTGFLFLILQVMIILGTSSDNLVIAQVLGASAVSAYAVTQKLFAATMISQYFIAPLWPAFGEAAARRDYAWARKTLDRALKVTFVMGAATALPLFLFGKTVLSCWIGPGVVPSTLMLAGFALYVLLSGYGGVMSTFLSSGELVGRQTLFLSLSSLCALGLKVLLAYRWQSAGVIWATNICFGAFYVIPAWRLAYGSLKEGLQTKNAALDDFSPVASARSKESGLSNA